MIGIDAVKKHSFKDLRKAAGERDGSVIGGIAPLSLFPQGNDVSVFPIGWDNAPLQQEAQKTSNGMVEPWKISFECSIRYAIWANGAFLAAFQGTKNLRRVKGRIKTVTCCKSWRWCFEQPLHSSIDAVSMGLLKSSRR